MADNMGNMTITSTNSLATLRVPGLYNSPITLEAFATDAEKINVTEIFKNLSPDTKVKVI